MSVVGSVRNRLRKFASSAMRDRVRRAKIEKRKAPGPPPGADAGSLTDLAQQLLDAPPRRFRHASVSGYKEANAFVVWVDDAAGRTKRFFYKDVNLTPEHYPAIVGFPGRPGVPEAAFFGAPTGALASFLPPVLAHLELQRDEHYQYFLADLNATHRWGFKHADIMGAVDTMLDVSAAIGEWCEQHSADRLIHYDGDFADVFLGYAHDALGRFGERTDDPRTAKLLSRWADIDALYRDETPDHADDAIHGDFRRDNMFHDRRDPTRIAVVDWEYAGIGWIHNDLVSLLKMSGPATVEPALGKIIAARPNRTPEEHRRLYERCRLERGLLDAALVANQRLAKSPNPTLSDTHFTRINDAYAQLTGKPPVPIA